MVLIVFLSISFLLWEGESNLMSLGDSPFLHGYCLDVGASKRLIILCPGNCCRNFDFRTPSFGLEVTGWLLFILRPLEQLDCSCVPTHFKLASYQLFWLAIANFFSIYPMYQICLGFRWRWYLRNFANFGLTPLICQVFVLTSLFWISISFHFCPFPSK